MGEFKPGLTKPPVENQGEHLWYWHILIKS